MGNFSNILKFTMILLINETSRTNQKVILTISLRLYKHKKSP
ncbi:hypothetical protein BB050_02336 [Flavobacterium anhuiense]|uniref:Uncharacterized protein n=1 Tax=Flavobacterium anhuiense TaxID=459526 RepID=A0AAC9D0R5_9FLAO|nr:hypothetical protein BB050_02336 [Flavobacterium anhuiense]